MSFKQSQILLTIFIFVLFFTLSFSKSPNLHTICTKTLYPSFCISTVTNTNLQPNTIHDYTQILINQSLTKANNFNLLVNKHLQSHNKKNALKSLQQALEDCNFLTNLNIEFLSSTSHIMDIKNSLTIIDINQVQTMLSATITNLDTCSKGLKETQLSQSSVIHEISSKISNYTMLLSLSLASFMFWVPKKSTTNYYLSLRYDQFNELEDYFKDIDTYSRRKLLQVGGRRIIVNNRVVVNPNGGGDFTTISDAVKAAPKNTKASDGYFEIYVVAGIYEEYVNIPTNKQYVLMIGEGINQTIITGNHSVKGGGNWSTYNSSTFGVTGKGFVAVNLTVRNTAGPEMEQAVALRSGADLSAFYRCSFEGYQDTLYAHSMRQFYKECDIYGTIDFIFGNSAAVLQDCNIYVRRPLKHQSNIVTAQGRTDPNQITGFSIQNCKILAADDLLASNYTVKNYLGRPWKEYSRTIYMHSFIDKLIEPAGWLEWSGRYALDTLYYGEYNNKGPGADTSKRVTWLGYHIINETIASYFTVSYFIVGNFWLPLTGIPYH